MRLGLAIVAIALACGGTQARQGEEEHGLLIFEGEIAETSIWLDGSFVADGARATGGVLVAPGGHLLEVRRDGYHSLYREVSVVSDQRLVVRVELAPSFE